MTDEKDIFADLWKRKKESLEILSRGSKSTTLISKPKSVIFESPKSKEKKINSSLQYNDLELPDLSKQDEPKPIIKKSPVKPSFIEEMKASTPKSSFAPTNLVNLTALKGIVLEDLEAENEELMQENQELRDEIDNHLAILKRMRQSFKKTKREKQALGEDNIRLQKMKQELDQEREELKNDIETLKQEKLALREVFKDLEYEIGGLRDKNVELEDKLDGLTDIKQSEKDRKIQLMQAELEADRFRKENEELIFKLGELEQKLVLKKLGVLSEEKVEDPSLLEEKSNKVILDLKSQINRFEEQLRLKELEYKARVEIYKKAISSKGDLDKLGDIADLQIILKEQEDELKAKDLLLENYKKQETTLTTSDGSPQVKGDPLDLSRKIITLEKLLIERDNDLELKSMLMDNLKAQLADAIEKIANYETQAESTQTPSKDVKLDIELLNNLMLRVSRMRTPESELEKRLKEYSLVLTRLARDNDRLHAQLVDAYLKLAELDSVSAVDEVEEEKNSSSEFQKPS